MLLKSISPFLCAFKYSDELISIGKTGNEAFIRMEDSRIGIPKDEWPKVFDHFYRVDKGRTRKQGGSGLGLSMAKEIADAINVRIVIDSLEGRRWANIYRIRWRTFSGWRKY